MTASQAYAAPPASLPLAACLTLLTAVHVCYAIGVGTGHVEWCIPYVEGCTSISRASRNPPAVYVYRALISSTGVLLAVYWVAWARWLPARGAGIARARAIAVLGVIAAVCLVANAAILGENDPLLRTLRRWLVIGFFFLTFGACAVSASVLPALHRAGSGPSRGIVRTKLTIVALLFALGALHYLVVPFVSALEPLEDRLQNVVEWQWVALLGAYLATTAAAWRTPRAA